MTPACRAGAIVVSALWMLVGAPAAAAVLSCSGGRFVVDGGSLVRKNPADPEVLAVSPGNVVIVAACEGRRVRLRSTASGHLTIRARLIRCGNPPRTVRLRARILAPGCDLLRGIIRPARGGKPRRFTARRSVCGDGVRDPGAGEACDDGNTVACDGCAADCARADRCIDGVDCAPYVRPELPPIAACGEPSVDDPRTLLPCTIGSGNIGRWTVDADGLPAYDLAIDQRCDPAARPWSPRPRPPRDPLHILGNGRGLMAMARASGAVELYTQDRGHAWVNRVDLWRDPEHPAFPPQAGGGFSYLVRKDGTVHSTRFEDLPVGDATTRQSRRIGIGYVETTTRFDGIVVRRRTFAPDDEARALVSEVTVANETDAPIALGLVELWDPNLHQLAVELLTSDLLAPGTTDGVERRRRALAGRFRQHVAWDPVRRLAVLTTTAKELPSGITGRHDPDRVDWFPDPVWLAVLDDGVPPDRVWLTDRELWGESAERPPPAALQVDGDGAPARALDLDGEGQPAVLAVRVPLDLVPGGRATRRFAFGIAPGGGRPDEALARLRARATRLAADTAAAWRERLVWAAFPGLAGSAVLQRELAWSTYGALANTSFDEYRGLRVLGQGGAYRFIHGLEGAMGDLALFAEALLLIDPPLARETLAYALSSQLGASTATPWRFPYATTGHGMVEDVIIYDKRSDAYWFLPAIIGRYVGLTRDDAWLASEIPFWPRAAGEHGTVLDHIARGLDYAESVLGYGARGLVAMGTNDYADGVLALAGSDVVATPTGTSSTYNAGMIVYGFPLAAAVVASRDPGLADRMTRIREGQAAALLERSWEGRFFWRGFVDGGSPLAPHLFFLEPQVFPVLADLVDRQRRDAALDLVAALLDRGSYGAISNVEVGTSGPIGGIDLPQIGGVWPVANAWLTAALARRTPAEGWSSFRRNTLAAHAERFPELWYGIWTGPDSYNGEDRARPGEADAHLATALTDYPALNAHVHTGPLRALVDLVGVQGTPEGIRIVPRLPTETFHVRWPRLAIRSAPERLDGETTMEAPFELEVQLPSGLRDREVDVFVDESPVSTARHDGTVRFAVPAGRVHWRVVQAPAR